MSEPLHPASILDRFHALAGRYCWQSECLFTWQGMAVPAFIRPRSGAPRIYLSAGIHGDEPAGPLAILALMEADKLHADVEWRLCPLVNPAAAAIGSRLTPDGIDLNRDYKQRRSAEAKAHTAWLEKQPAANLFLSLHEDDETSGFYLYEINCKRTASIAPQILAATADIIPADPTPIIDQHSVCAEGWIDHPPEPDEPEGWPEAIFIAQLGTPLSYTFETPSSAPLEKRVACHRAAVTEAVRLFLTRQPPAQP